jgi:hypothetical protein
MDSLRTNTTCGEYSILYNNINNNDTSEMTSTVAEKVTLYAPFNNLNYKHNNQLSLYIYSPSFVPGNLAELDSCASRYNNNKTLRTH